MNVTVTKASAVSFLIVLFTIQAELTLNSQQQGENTILQAADVQLRTATPKSYSAYSRCSYNDNIIAFGMYR